MLVAALHVKLLPDAMELRAARLVHFEKQQQGLDSHPIYNMEAFATGLEGFGDWKVAELQRMQPLYEALMDSPLFAGHMMIKLAEGNGFPSGQSLFCIFGLRNTKQVLAKRKSSTAQVDDGGSVGWDEEQICFPLNSPPVQLVAEVFRLNGGNKEKVAEGGIKSIKMEDLWCPAPHFAEQQIGMIGKDGSYTLSLLVQFEFAENGTPDAGEATIAQDSSQVCMHTFPCQLRVCMAYLTERRAQYEDAMARFCPPGVTLCRDGARCPLLADANENHMMSFWHPQPDPRASQAAAQHAAIVNDGTEAQQQFRICVKGLYQWAVSDSSFDVLQSSLYWLWEQFGTWFQIGKPYQQLFLLRVTLDDFELSADWFDRVTNRLSAAREVRQSHATTRAEEEMYQQCVAFLRELLRRCVVMFEVFQGESGGDEALVMALQLYTAVYPVDVVEVMKGHLGEHATRTVEYLLGSVAPLHPERELEEAHEEPEHEEEQVWQSTLIQ